MRVKGLGAGVRVKRTPSPGYQWRCEMVRIYGGGGLIHVGQLLPI